jgi:hypothetical protein
MEYYPALKKNGMMSFAEKLMELEIIMLSDISQTQKAKYACSHSYVESRSKMTMIVGQECKRETAGCHQEGRGEERVLKGEH